MKKREVPATIKERGRSGRSEKRGEVKDWQGQEGEVDGALIAWPLSAVPLSEVTVASH